MLGPLLLALYLVWVYRDQLFGRAWTCPCGSASALALLIVGWQLARDIGRAVGPALFRRLDPGTAGTVGFLLRLVTMLVVGRDRGCASPG